MHLLSTAQQKERIQKEEEGKKHTQKHTLEARKAHFSQKEPSRTLLVEPTFFADFFPFERGWKLIKSLGAEFTRCCGLDAIRDTTDRQTASELNLGLELTFGDPSNHLSNREKRMTLCLEA